LKLAYVDTSCLVAIAFKERGAASVLRRMDPYDALLASNLVEAELLAACAREKVEGADHLLAWLGWVIPDRPLSPEIKAVLAVRPLRGADLWHLATALYAIETPGEMTFLTLDARQKEVAGALGFVT
jgi:predicted nucleic acid-binding protein